MAGRPKRRDRMNGTLFAKTGDVIEAINPRTKQTVFALVDSLGGGAVHILPIHADVGMATNLEALVDVVFGEEPPGEQRAVVELTLGTSGQTANLPPYQIVGKISPADLPGIRALFAQFLGCPTKTTFAGMDVDGLVMQLTSPGRAPAFVTRGVAAGPEDPRHASRKRFHRQVSWLFDRDLG